jgi:hypothetical protein
MEMEPWEVWVRSTELHKFVQHHEFGLWPLMQTLHLVGFTLLFGTVGLFDLRALGVAKGIPPRLFIASFLGGSPASSGTSSSASYSSRCIRSSIFTTMHSA